MIRGVVNARNEIRIPLPVVEVAGHEQLIDAIVDTGFDGAWEQLLQCRRRVE